MNLTATDAKNRLGQVLEQAQSQPVFIDKSGRRHSVVISAARYEELLRAEAGGATQATLHERQQRFGEQYKDWIEAQHQFITEFGVFGDEWRQW